MKKNDFLQTLQERAQEQQKLHKEIPFPSVFLFIATHLGDHPWRPLIPLSVLVSIALYYLFGSSYINFVLWIFKVL